MSFINTNISYAKTNAFSKLVLDYLANETTLQPFYNFKPDIDGLKNAIAERQAFPVNRQLLVDVLIDQYKGIEKSDKLQANINKLLSDKTFTICAAHQPNIFTGHLYFIYKILHAVKLADTLTAQMPECNFVPVYYMGSEDADLDELGEVFINGIHYKWQTKQTGAVGRMIIDKNFIEIIHAIAGQLMVEKNGEQIVHAIQKFYTEGKRIDQATFEFVHFLFGKYGLVVLLPDNSNLKNAFASIITKELEEQFSEKAVVETLASFPKQYKVQTAGRPINLFYLKNDIRERIEKSADGYEVANTNYAFTTNELLAELKSNPERFSPNVILRPLFQETILPNVAFIGGGGELAYWLELKNVFKKANVFFPALVLRNSFTIVNIKTDELITKLGLTAESFFTNENILLENIVKKESELKLNIADEKELLKKLYDTIKKSAGGIDTTLNCHVHALQVQALNKLEVLEKKMMKAEKKKFEAQQRHISKVKLSLFPNGILQERINNILEYVSVYGIEFVDELYQNSNAFADSFTILTEKTNG
jgi:bacillithiol synthase